ncbi:hypothetical protein GQ42DRAFT_165590 [Ramicandelaber brevisporus]|nr:hypothetical protein GQ42DRAFT_165590 [Ramicandelaber brevisporus]
MSSNAAIVDGHSDQAPSLRNISARPTESCTDEQSISLEEAKASLETSLPKRPSVDYLKQNNIIKNTRAAPSLQPAASELEHKLVGHYVKQGIENHYRQGTDGF